MIIKRVINPIIIDLSLAMTIPFNNINIAWKINAFTHKEYFSFSNDIQIIIIYLLNCRTLGTLLAN